MAKPDVPEQQSETRMAVEELTEAIRLTVEYAGIEMLPPIEGWSWYDALVKYAPEKAQVFRTQLLVGGDQ